MSALQEKSYSIETIANLAYLHFKETCLCLNALNVRKGLFVFSGALRQLFVSNDLRQLIEGYLCAPLLPFSANS